ncbi:hypothetical protein BVI434_1210040 [Burkholderia vietnamiensis]|nr:hypothetical protein BVI434_1210040 [Burkholderia vietnamiensis]
MVDVSDDGDVAKGAGHRNLKSLNAQTRTLVSHRDTCARVAAWKPQIIARRNVESRTVRCIAASNAAAAAPPTRPAYPPAAHPATKTPQATR